MAAQSFRVILTQSAWADIEDIAAYWTDRDESERGEQYAHDPPSEAIRQLSDPGTAEAAEGNREVGGRASTTPGATCDTRPTRRRRSYPFSNARIASSTS